MFALLHFFFMSTIRRRQDAYPIPKKQDALTSNVNGETRDLASLKADKTDPKSTLHKAYGRVHTILFFVGYPRSRHSLLGSLLDAHPHMVISDESTAFSRWKDRQTTWIRESIFSFYDTISSASERASTKGRRSFSLEGTVANTSSAYGYHVPNQWQGRYDEYIEVIGDKAGGLTASALLSSNAVDAVHLLQKASGAKVKFVHVVRNPFDNIATMVLRHSDLRKRTGDHQQKVEAPEIMATTIRRYFHLAEGSQKARSEFPSQVIDISSKDFVQFPAETLRRICDFLEIGCSERYIQDCSSIVDTVPSKTRDFVEWSVENKMKVENEMKRFPFLKDYSYND